MAYWLNYNTFVLQRFVGLKSQNKSVELTGTASDIDSLLCFDMASPLLTKEQTP